MELSDQLTFVPTKEEAPNPADWFINGYLYGKAPASTLQRDIEGTGNHTYHLVDVYPQWGLSGDTWALYRLNR